MTEFWVSQGQKWCEYCKVWMSNNTASIRIHEGGKGHKENVAAKLSAIRKDAVNKAKEKKEAEKTIGAIEKAAQRQYEKDLAEQSKAMARSKANATSASSEEGGRKVLPPPAMPPPAHLLQAAKSRSASEGWALDGETGYFFNDATGYHYDPNSGLFYSDLIGKWETAEECGQSAPSTGVRQQTASPAQPNLSSQRIEGAADVAASGQKRSANVALPGPLVKKPAISGKAVRGVASSLAVQKPVIGRRFAHGSKEQNKGKGGGKGKVSSEEAKALAAREAARQRVLEREKKNMGLFS